MDLDTLGGRKNVLTLATLICATVALVYGAITPQQWLDLLPVVLGIGVGGIAVENVSQAIAESRKPAEPVAPSEPKQ